MPAHALAADMSKMCIIIIMWANAEREWWGVKCRGDWKVRFPEWDMGIFWYFEKLLFISTLVEQIGHISSVEILAVEYGKIPDWTEN